MRRLYIDKRYFTSKRLQWVSFESSPHLSRTKADIYGKCVPCITSLYEQLKEGLTQIRLGPAYNCWKIVIPLPGKDECVRFLHELEKDLPDNVDVKGRFGSSDPSKSTTVVVVSAENDRDRDRLYDILKICASKTNPGTVVLIHRACANLYHELLGHWEHWDETVTVKNPAAVETVLKKIRNMLFWETDASPEPPARAK